VAVEHRDLGFEAFETLGGFEVHGAIVEIGGPLRISSRVKQRGDAGEGLEQLAEVRV
jgi:hypothetical protein